METTFWPGELEDHNRAEIENILRLKKKGGGHNILSYVSILHILGTKNIYQN